MALLRLAALQIKTGSTEKPSILSVESQNVTVLVGPNNSGKSLLLREIELWCKGGAKDNKFRILEDIKTIWPANGAEAIELLRPFSFESLPGHPAAPGRFWLFKPAIANMSELRAEVREDLFQTWLDNGDLLQLQRHILSYLTIRLDGRTRFTLVEPKPTGPLEHPAENHLWALFIDEDARRKVRQFTNAAFGKYFVIDPTALQQFRVRLSDVDPKDVALEQSLAPEARTFHAAAPLVSDLGDGVKASVGLVSAVMSLPDRVLLVDEPEAFLHPTLSRRLGSVLARTARERDASLFVATHSAEFLIGCIESVPEISVVRLTYAGGVATARSLTPADVASLMRDPLMRSANAVRAIFHRGVVVTEADRDRAFYDEINVRLVAHGKGIEDAQFMNAQNWQTIPRIVAPLRALGVPSAAIFDFDVLADDGFKCIWPLLNQSNDQLQLWWTRRDAAKKAIETAGKKECKTRGLAALQDGDRESVSALLRDFATFGIYFVPVGEVEGWLRSELGEPTRSGKSEWLTNAFERLGSAPDSASYVHPGEGDVWEFVSGIRRWIDDPARRGIPD